MEGALGTFEAVKAALQSLPATPTGKVRVYRGQAPYHRKMLPTGLRSHTLERRVLWRVYSKVLANDLRSRAGLESETDPSTGLTWNLTDPTEIDEWIIWTQAIAQHYGPGSNFLDVTYSLETALWFALHEMKTGKSRSMMGQPGPVDPQNDVLMEQSWNRYEPWTQAPGWLYVFDVPIWDCRGYPKHGTLLDLTKAPFPYSSSARVRVQQACLLSADPSVKGGDLASLCEPLPVCWPLAGTPSLTAPTENLFPPPSRDEWYARFLAIPALLQAIPDAQAVSFAQPLRIRLYAPSKNHEIYEDIGRRVVTLRPPLLYRSLLENPPESGWKLKLEESFEADLADATPILLEGPLQATTPSADSDQWNHGLLSGDMDDTAVPVDLATRKKMDPVSLANVFIEFSPLEKVGWERVEQSGGEIDMARGMWLIRRSNMMVALLLLETVPTGRRVLIGPIQVRYDPKSGHLKWGYFEDFSEHVGWTAPIAKPIFSELTLLRDLSRGWKASPYPLILRDDKDALVRVAKAVCRLTTCRSAAGYYLPRNIALADPYIGPGGYRPDEFPIMTMTLKRGFVHVDAEDLRKLIGAKFSQGLDENDENENDK